MNFVAIDFETANAKRSSACSVGVAVVENGEITNTFKSFIKPTPFEFNPFNTSVHGIEPESVINAPEFLDVWDSISSISNGYPLIAHNAAFDMSVIRHGLDLTNTNYPCVKYLCTMLLAKHVIPNAGSYRLDFLCHMFDIELEHHQALSDAVGCAKLMLELSSRKNVFSLTDLRDVMQFGELYTYDTGYGYRNGYSPARLQKPSSCKSSAISSLSNAEINQMEVLCENDFFKDKNFCFTGTLKSMKRNLAKALVVKSGGIVQASTTLSTNYLVTGIQTHPLSQGKLSQKLKRAMELAEKGQDIQIIEEDEFLEMLSPDVLESAFNTD